jgi:hypothetical protein
MGNDYPFMRQTIGFGMKLGIWKLRSFLLKFKKFLSATTLSSYDLDITNITTRRVLICI